MQVVGCNAVLMGMLPWLFGAFLADFSAISWSWFQLPLAVCAIVLHLVIAILQVSFSPPSLYPRYSFTACAFEEETPSLHCVESTGQLQTPCYDTLCKEVGEEHFDMLNDEC